MTTRFSSSHIQVWELDQKEGCCSVAKLCPTLCDPMDYTIPGFPVIHYLLEFAQTHVHWVGDAIQPSYPLSASSPLDLNLFPASVSFPISWLLVSCDQSAGASVLVSDLPMNVQVWFPFRIDWFISLQSKALSGVFSSTTVQKHQFFYAQLSFKSSLHICIWQQEKP